MITFLYLENYTNNGKMRGYSTFIENGGFSGGELGRLEFGIKFLAKRTLPVYVLAINNKRYSVETVKEKMKDVEDIRAFCKVYKTIDVIVQTEAAVNKVAEELHKRFETRVGVVKYQGRNMMRLSLELLEALNIARENKEPYHFYNPKKDSVEAIIKQALSETDSQR